MAPAHVTGSHRGASNEQILHKSIPVGFFTDNNSFKKLSASSTEGRPQAQGYTFTPHLQKCESGVRGSAPAGCGAAPRLEKIADLGPNSPQFSIIFLALSSNIQ